MRPTSAAARPRIGIALRLAALACFLSAACVGPGGSSAASAPPTARQDPATPGRQSPAAEEAAGSWQQQILEAHNRWRERYGTEPLSWSPELAAFAQDWAEELSGQGMRLEHRPDNPYGENLYVVRGRRDSPAEVVDAWGSEEELYDRERNDWWPDAGHFSQLVWHSTRKVGCGRARSGETEHWVCNYHPPGNFRGERPF